MTSRKILLLALFLLLLASTLAAKRMGSGERVEIFGTVTDAQGRTLAGVDVILVAARRQLSFRRLRMEDRDPIRIPTQTDDRGVFRLEWSWDRTYNRFDLQVGFPFRGPKGERFEKLESQDISLRVVDGGPVVVPITVQDARLLEDHRSFLDSIRTHDERRVYEGMGRPDRIDSSPEGAAWWYFPRGKVYRFTDGVLIEVSDFDPVKPFDGQRP